ncbi:MAG: GNAT family N-acetyltransferase [Spirochaetes bacterium]|nr:GNAT family N-acetyltransferase [Spirochaetota bacterium]
MKKLTYLSQQVFSASEIGAVNKLIRVCSAYDRTHESIDISVNSAYTCEPSLKLFHTAWAGKDIVGVTALFIPTMEEAELSGFVHPSYRNRGIFKNLLEKAVAELSAFNFPSLLFVCNDQSEIGLKMLKKAKIPYEFTEYSMILETDIAYQKTGITLKRAYKKNIDEFIALNVSIFKGSTQNARILLEKTFQSDKMNCYSFIYDNSVIGMGCTANTKPEDTASIFGFGILPEYRGKGLGKLSLYELTHYIHTHYKKPARLEVNSRNQAALSLYTSLGFKTDSAYRYYRKPIISLSLEEADR